MDIPAGEYVATLPINFTLGGNNANSRICQINIFYIMTTVDDFHYQSNITALSESFVKCYSIQWLFRHVRYVDWNLRLLLEGQKDPFTVTNHKAYVHDDNGYIYLYGT